MIKIVALAFFARALHGSAAGPAERSRTTDRGRAVHLRGLLVRARRPMRCWPSSRRGRTCWRCRFMSITGTGSAGRTRFRARRRPRGSSITPRLLGLGTVYTPQIVVDGRWEGVGSDRAAVAQALDQPPQPSRAAVPMTLARRSRARPGSTLGPAAARGAGLGGADRLRPPPRRCGRSAARTRAGP